MRIIDCSIGIQLLTSRTGTDISAFVDNSYISVLERKDCDFCYGEKTIKCKNGKGVELFVAGKERSLNAKAFLTNVEFRNYSL